MELECCKGIKDRSGEAFITSILHVQEAHCQKTQKHRLAVFALCEDARFQDKPKQQTIIDSKPPKSDLPRPSTTFQKLNFLWPCDLNDTN